MFFVEILMKKMIEMEGRRVKDGANFVEENCKDGKNIARISSQFERKSKENVVLKNV